MAKPKVAIKEELMKEFCRIGRDYDYKHQAIFFLNAFWVEYGEKECENIWDFVQIASEMDQKEREKGHSMDEFQAHRFLEKYGETLTVVAMRKKLKEIDLDSDNRMSLLEYFVYKFTLDVTTLMTRPQGTNEALEKAEKALEEVLSEIAKLERKKAKLQKKSAKGGVKGKAAANELEQIFASDPLPIRKALVTAQASIRAAKKTKNLNAMGKLWFIDREVAEAAKYKPKANWKRK